MGLMNSLEQPTQQQSSGRKANNTFGLVLRVATAEKIAVGEAESLKITGHVVSAGSPLPAETLVEIDFRTAGDKAITNFLKGNGKKSLNTLDESAGSFITLENCYTTDQVNDAGLPVISSRWLNTLSTAGDPDHANRSFLEDVYASAPRLSFKNPTKKTGEPDTITLPVNAKNVRFRVEEDGARGVREFSREWAVGKLNELPANARIGVTIDQIEPKAAVRVDGQDAFHKAIRDALGTGTKSLAVVRISDGESIRARSVYVSFKRNEAGEYVPDVDKAITELQDKNIIRNIPNEKLFGAIEQGLVVEVIPGYRLTYAGDPSKDNNAAFKLVNDVKRDAAARYEMMFGDDPMKFTKVILPGIARNDSSDGFSPINVITDTVGNHDITELVSPHIAPPRAPALKEADDHADAPVSSAEPGSDEEEPSAPRP
ncbi:hypothetical protein LMG667_02530 [Xanthomonas euvesicatoria]|uniref:hypothetical protein n=1 Tax=Xanthomonas euvesicatoria TaxID=456327 RepID=UPI00080E1DDD|nr:hypothetical protein [Xanthomonas euvesicatoria]OCG90316.1 hypothetical protein LMG667_02530 [Xanthomonas euvesicatoria]